MAGRIAGNIELWLWAERNRYRCALAECMSIGEGVIEIALLGILARWVWTHRF